MDAAAENRARQASRDAAAVEAALATLRALAGHYSGHLTAHEQVSLGKAAEVLAAQLAPLRQRVAQLEADEGAAAGGESDTAEETDEEEVSDPARTRHVCLPILTTWLTFHRRRGWNC